MMKREPLRKLFQLPGPILSLTLIGILLLSAVLYYRAVKIQRFLEPALAISTPRVAFAKNIKHLISGEFGIEGATGIRFTTSSIFVDRSLIASGVRGTYDTASLKKLGRVFVSVLKDPDMRDYVDFILIISPLPLSADTDLNERRRVDLQHRSELILDSLYRASPDLKDKYGKYFAASVVPVQSREGEAGWVEFRFIPSERLHIEVLKSLQKYVH